MKAQLEVKKKGKAYRLVYLDDRGRRSEVESYVSRKDVGSIAREYGLAFACQVVWPAEGD
jgi:hypothetical protein